MFTPKQPLTITISNTATGEHDYMQITYVGQYSVNIVLISSKITVNDVRTEEGGTGRDR